VETGICLFVIENLCFVYGVFECLYIDSPLLSLSSRSSFMPTGCYIAELDLDLDFGI